LAAQQIKKVCYFTVLRMILLHPSLYRPLFSYLFTVIRYFFFPQYETMLLRRRRVVNVDHELDVLIPYRPQYAGIYLSFIHMWIKSLQFMYTEFGGKSIPYIADFFRQLGFLYREAYAVYRVCQSTTRRPKKISSWRVLLIHLADPHLHCVPSLHVLVVCFTWIKMRDFLLQEKSGNYHKTLDALYEEALVIIETIIYMKQHSLNCIAAGLFVFSRLFPHCGFSAEKFCSELFTRLEKPSCKNEVTAAMVSTYQKLDSAYKYYTSCGCGDYKTVLLDFLTEKPKHNIFINS